MELLRERVRISRVVLLSVTIVTAALMSRTVIINKGGYVTRGYDLWLLILNKDTYVGAGVPDIFMQITMVAIFTFVLAVISLGVGWLVAAIAGSISLLLRRRA